MDYNHIKKLLNKYWEGETELHEEQELKEYFNSGNIAEDLKEFQPFFVYLEEEKKSTSKQDFATLFATPTNTKTLSAQRNQNTPVRILVLKWSAVAASILLLIAVGLQYNYSTVTNKTEDPKLIADTYKNPDQAYQEAKAALLLISNKLNKGMNKGREGIIKVKN